MYKLVGFGGKVVLRVFLVQLKAIPKMFRVKMVIKRAMIVAKLRKFVEKGGFHGNKKYLSF